MDTRREFLKKAGLLSGGVGLYYSLPASIQKAFSINPDPGSTYLDAEHIVILMQENRSFDHTYGTLRGVRGFNDPHAIKLPNKNPVWLQTNEAGETYAPFRLNIKDTKITWMGSLPHGWTNQVDATNNGKHNRWLEVKKSDNKEYASMPLTMGYYTRDDIPFYYAMADAFTVCDQNFCSSLTGTTPNRLYFWTGTIREEQNENSKANVWNEDADYNTMVSWKTFPERLEENDISWKIYQNDIGIDSVFTDEQDQWMSNFGDNPIEYFTQYNVKLSARYIDYLHQKASILPGEIDLLEKQIQLRSPKNKKSDKLKKELEEKKKLFIKVTDEQKIFTKENYELLTQHEKNIHEKAFAANTNAPDFYELTSLKYTDGDVEREIKIPKGDIFHQFRDDVKNAKLPMVSWLVAPENFSDHPSAAWFGEWYISEAMDILTQNPDVWKKTIFILAYDENDGYFDHVPPFTAPNSKNPETGKTSEGIDTSVDYVTMEQERRKKGADEKYMRESSIGLGYRVPLVIASPWSRGGFVCSEIFDHTSTLQFLEKFLSDKTGKKIKETNISDWRRTVCGDLTSVFRPYNGEKINIPDFVEKNPFIEKVHKAKFKKEPNNYKKLSQWEIELIKKEPLSNPLLPKQEKGNKASCPLPYELYVDGKLSADKKSFEINFEAANKIFGNVSAGAPFKAYTPEKYLNENMRQRSYAVEAGSHLKDEWLINNFENSNYHICVYGPNGFFRQFAGNNNDPLIEVMCQYTQGNIDLKVNNKDNATYNIEIIDNVYKQIRQIKFLDTANSNNSTIAISVNLDKSFGWYDFSIKIKGNNLFEKRYAGHVETGKESRTDPAMGS